MKKFITAAAIAAITVSGFVAPVFVKVFEASGSLGG